MKSGLCLSSSVLSSSFSTFPAALLQVSWLSVYRACLECSASWSLLAAAVNQQSLSWPYCWDQPLPSLLSVALLFLVKTRRRKSYRKAFKLLMLELSRTEHLLFLKSEVFSISIWGFCEMGQWNLPTIKVILEVKQLKVLNVLIAEYIVMLSQSYSMLNLVFHFF